jgi:hypothetical protein
MGTWDTKDTEETEITFDVDRGKDTKEVKDTSVVSAPNPTENPGSIWDKIEKALSNPLVIAAGVGGIGVAASMLGKSKDEAGNTIIGKVLGGNKPDTSW